MNKAALRKITQPLLGFALVLLAGRTFKVLGDGIFLAGMGLVFLALLAILLYAKFAPSSRAAAAQAILDRDARLAATPARNMGIVRVYRDSGLVGPIIHVTLGGQTVEMLPQAGFGQWQLLAGTYNLAAGVKGQNVLTDNVTGSLEIALAVGQSLLFEARVQTSLSKYTVSLVPPADGPAAMLRMRQMILREPVAGRV